MKRRPGKSFFIFLALVTLASLVSARVLGKNEGDSAQPQSQQASGGSDLKLARERVAKLEAQAYEKDPMLKQAEQERAHWNRLDAEATRRGLMVATYLEQEDKNRGEKKATEEYKKLLGAWHDLHLAHLVKNDPKASAVLKALLAGDSGLRKGLAENVYGHSPTEDETNDVEKLWQAFEKSVSDSERRGQRVKKLEKESEFPQFVLQHAEQVSLEKVLSYGIYFSYLQLKTPEELTKARAELARLSGGKEKGPQ